MIRFVSQELYPDSRVEDSGTGSQFWWAIGSVGARGESGRVWEREG